MHHHHHIMSALGYEAFFILGLLGGIHCLGMCAPLSTLLISGSPSRWKTLGIYHLSRVFSYTLTGFSLAFLGVNMERVSPFPIVAWIITIPLCLYIIGYPLKPPSPTIKLQSKLLRIVQQKSPSLRALLLGLFTPLIPCGILYGALATSLAAPSPSSGGLWMTSFALGTIPLLALGQAGIEKFQRFLIPRHYSIFMRTLAGITLILFWVFYWMHHS